ncbi:MAG: biopolymer transporter ExbD [Desulfatibacillaceae bacterium]|nr:biopolymer transporter ExbD [Desulfatibacillaceae bacterium]
MLNIAQSRRALRKTVDINIAPLIDMVFILLIFFLVTTSFVRETGIDVNRPVAGTATSQEKATILVGITADNRVFMEKRQIDIRSVGVNIERAMAENPEGQVVVVADKDSSTGTVIAVMDAARMAGAKSVSLAASLEQGAF